MCARIATAMILFVTAIGFCNEPSLKAHFYGVKGPEGRSELVQGMSMSFMLEYVPPIDRAYEEENESLHVRRPNHISQSEFYLTADESIPKEWYKQVSTTVFNSKNEEVDVGKILPINAQLLESTGRFRRSRYRYVISSSRLAALSEGAYRFVAKRGVVDTEWRVTVRKPNGSDNDKLLVYAHDLINTCLAGDYDACIKKCDLLKETRETYRESARVDFLLSRYATRSLVRLGRFKDALDNLEYCRRNGFTGNLKLIKHNVLLARELKIDVELPETDSVVIHGSPILIYPTFRIDGRHNALRADLEMNEPSSQSVEPDFDVVVEKPNGGRFMAEWRAMGPRTVDSKGVLRHPVYLPADELRDMPPGKYTLSVRYCNATSNKVAFEVIRPKTDVHKHRIALRKATVLYEMNEVDAMIESVSTLVLFAGDACQDGVGSYALELLSKAYLKKGWKARAKHARERLLLVAPNVWGDGG